MKVTTIKEYSGNLGCVLGDSNDVVITSAGATSSKGVFSTHGGTSGVVLASP